MKSKIKGTILVILFFSLLMVQQNFSNSGLHEKKSSKISPHLSSIPQLFCELNITWGW